MPSKGLFYGYLIRIRNREAPAETDNSEQIHIFSPVSTVLTLCGWVDVSHEVVDEGTPDCPDCLAVVEHVRGLLPHLRNKSRRRASPTPTKGGRYVD